MVELSRTRALLARFSRVTSNARFVPEIDGLRFAAIAAVFFFHLDGYVSRVHAPSSDPVSHVLVQLNAQGHYGVQLFFLISGFILALPFATQHLRGGSPVSLGSYFWRRVTRLEPPYLLTLVLLYVLLVATHKADARSLFPHLAASSGYLHNVLYRGPSRVNGVAWSLEIEIQFYLLVPLLTRVFTLASATARRALISAVMIGIAFYQRATPSDSLPGFTIAFFLQYFLAGFLLADLYIVDWNERPTQGLAFDALGVASVAALIAVCIRDYEVRLLFPFLSLAFAVAAFRGRIFSALFRLPLLTTIGGMCYSIYLLHYQVISAVARKTAPAAAGHPYWSYFALQTVVVGAATLIVCGLLFLLVEKPCMRRDWPRRARISIASWFGAQRAEAKAP